jgi:hypothetical protein
MTALGYFIDFRWCGGEEQIGDPGTVENMG